MKKLFMALLAGTVLLAACEGSRSSADYAEKMIDSAKRDTASPKLVKTADMRLKVNNVPQSAEVIALLASSFDGLVVHNNLQSNVVAQQDIVVSSDSIKKLSVYNTTADMTVRIPAEKIEQFMDKLNHVSVFTDNRKMDIEDRTLDYLQQELKAENRDKSARMRKHIKLTQRGADSILQLKDDAVDRRISNLRTKDSANYSTLTIALYQSNTVHKEMVANDDLSGYNSSVSVKAGMALQKGWTFFADLVVGLLHLWAFILAGGIIWFIIYRYQKKKRENGKLISETKS